MRLAYVCYWDVASGDGVAQKIGAQVQAWSEAGHDVQVFAIRPAGPAERWRQSVAAARTLRAFAPDAVYLRYDLFLPPIWRVVGRFPTVVEINSDERKELALRPGRHLRLAFNAVNRRFVVGRARGVVAVTHELAAGLANRRRRTRVIPNGIDVASVSWLPAPPADSQRRTKFVFLGSAGMAWHGIDKIVELARLAPGCDFEIIGMPPDSAPSHPNLVVRPQLPREEYIAALASADVGLGTLALHRKGMEEACPLKVREYLAHGLPVVFGYRDPDFAGDEPWYLLRLPNVEDNVTAHVGEIIAFAERVRGRRVQRQEVADHIDSAVKERQRLDFLAELADQQSSA